MIGVLKRYIYINYMDNFWSNNRTIKSGLFTLIRRTRLYNSVQVSIKELSSGVMRQTDPSNTELEVNSYKGRVGGNFGGVAKSFSFTVNLVFSARSNRSIISYGFYTNDILNFHGFTKLRISPFDFVNSQRLRIKFSCILNPSETQKTESSVFYRQSPNKK